MNLRRIEYFNNLKKSPWFLVFLTGGIVSGVVAYSIVVDVGLDVSVCIILTIIMALVFCVSSRSYLLVLLAIFPVFELDIFITRGSVFFLGTEHFNIISLIYLELIFLTVAYFIFKGVSNVWKLSVFRPLILFSFFISLNLLLLSPDHWFGLRQWLRLIGWLSLILLLADHIRTKDDIQKFVIAAVIGLALPLSGALWSLLTGERTGLLLGSGYGIKEIAGWYPRGHVLPKILFSLMPWAVFLFLISNGKKTFFYFLLIAFSLISILYSYSRTTWVGVFVFLLILLFLGVVYKKKKYIYLTLLLFIIIVSFVFFNLESIVQRSPDLITPQSFPNLSSSEVTRYATSINEVGSGRIGVWLTLFQSWFDSSLTHKLFGQGISSVPKILNESSGAHNDYIGLLLETGLVGIALYWWFLIGVIKKLISIFRKSTDSYYGALASCSLALFSAFIVMSLFEAHLYAQISQLYIAGFIGIALGASENILSTVNKATSRQPTG